MNKVVGIDLGTTNSVVAVMEGGQPTVIPNAEGFRTTPSIVAYTSTGDVLRGQIAKRQAVINAENTFYSVKRFIGRKANEVPEEARQTAYKVVEVDGKIRLHSPILNKSLSPEEISAQILRKLANDASKYIGEKVTQAVVTVPAYFNDSQRQATKDAGKIAGLEVLRIINEPTAASLAYGLDSKDSETILVFDLGGGTFDVSILEVGDGVFEVLSTSGDTRLGGDNFDEKIVNWLIEDFEKEQGINLRNDSQAFQRLTEAAEKAKVELSNVNQTDIRLPFITADSTGPKHLDKTLTKSHFETICSELISRCSIPVENALRDSKLQANQIDEVVLVGGSTRIPAIKELVKGIINKAPNETVNPDEVVAIGAAIQAGVLSGEVKNILLLDVTPLSLGVETLGNMATKIIPRNTTVPSKKSQIFSTAVDNQETVEINVVQGEREFVADNKSLGTFRLEGIKPARRGVPKIEVTFDIDANGILSVTALDKGSNSEQTITITGSSTLPTDEVTKLVEEAERYAEADQKKVDNINLKNGSTLLCDQTEEQLAKIPEDKKAKVSDQIEEANATIRELRDAVEKEDYAVMDAIHTKLNSLMMDITMKVDQKASSNPVNDPKPNDLDDEDVIDINSDFTEDK